MSKSSSHFAIITKLSILISLIISIASGLWYLAAQDKSSALNAEDNRIQWSQLEELNQRIQRVEDRQHEQSDLLLQIVSGITPQNKAPEK